MKIEKKCKNEYFDTLKVEINKYINELNELQNQVETLNKDNNVGDRNGNSSFNFIEYEQKITNLINQLREKESYIGKLETSLVESSRLDISN
mmetsp:Transcript_29984/g.25290  ORF Transcript_29984/g.25290 Transcript_29984/m.25290 type:complete len:92 (+) Transcript_29984:608-883(+)